MEFFIGMVILFVLSNVTENNTHTSNHSCQDGNQCDVCDQMIIDEFS